jgi:hypothetical protein
MRIILLWQRHTTWQQVLGACAHKTQQEKTLRDYNKYESCWTSVHKESDVETNDVCDVL